MFKESPSLQEQPQEKQLGYSRREVDRIFEEAFRDVEGEGSDIGFHLPDIASRLMDRLGYGVYEVDEPTRRGIRRHAFKLVFRDAKEHNEQGKPMTAELAADFSVDREAGTATVTFEPLWIDEEQPKALEALAAIERLDRRVTFQASEQVIREMRELVASREKEARERETSLRRLREMAPAWKDRQLTPADFKENFGWLRHLPIPDVEEGTWEIFKDGGNWRFVSWQKNEANGVASIRDVIEFSDEAS